MGKEWYSRLVIVGVMLILLTAAGFAQETRDLTKYPVRFAIIGDRTGDEVPDIYPQVVAEIERLKPELLMTVGDMIEGYTENIETLDREWQEYFEVIKPLTMPVYFVPGNHDITTDGQLESYRKWTKSEPYYSFDYEGLHMVVLDNSRIEFSYEFDEEQVNWLTDDLEKHQDAAFTFVFYHKPLWYRTLGDGKPDKMHEIFVKYGVDVVFSGHFHRYFTGEYDGIKYVSLGASGGRQYGIPGDPGFHFMWVTVSDEIAMAPIKMNAVLPWDEIDVATVRNYETARHLGITFTNAAAVAENSLNVAKSAISVEVRNFNEEFRLADTVDWTVPDGWTVEPREAWVEAAPGGSATLTFDVSCDGELYPLPEFCVDFPYMDSSVNRAEKELRVARRVACPTVVKPLTIDGVVDESIWHCYHGRLLEQDGKEAIVDSAAFYFAHDQENVYFAAHCVENRMDSLYADLKEHDASVYGEDCVGFLYRPGGSRGPIYQLYVNPLGTTFDQEIKRESDGYWEGYESWDGEYEIATRKGAGFWEVEIRIPLSQFEAVAGSGEAWDFNFRRKQRRLDASGGWQVPHTYDPNSFGKLVME